MDQSPDGPIAEAELLPLMVLADGAEKASTKSGNLEWPKALERAASPRIFGY